MYQNNKKRVLFCINKLEVGGAERVFVKDANALSEMGYEVFFCLLFGEAKDQTLLLDLHIKSENIFYAGAKGFFDPSALSRTLTFISKNNIGVVYSTLNEANIFSRILNLLNSRLNIIIREANIADPKPIRFKFFDLILNIFVKKIVCVSVEVKSSLLKYQPFYKGKMVVLPNGVEVPLNQRVYSEITKTQKLLTVGSLTPKKGHKYLIEACAMLQEEKPDSFSLDIVGGGREMETLKKLVQEKGLERQVIFYGQINPEQVKEKLLSSDMFVLPSLWEGSPNVLLEAMACGLVCISTRVSGAINMIEDQVSGFLVQTGDSQSLANKLLEVLRNRNNFKTIGANARKRIEQNFAYPIYIKKLEHILN